MTFKSWLSYYQSNSGNFDHIEWNDLDKITLEELDTITSSIQQFQKGENSEGKNLIRYAEEFGDKDYFDSIILFIKEEQRHAMVLSEFMELNSIPKINEHWVDNVFRKLRVFSGIENSIVVLLTAEIIAAVYYRALKNATESKLLNDICRQILKDEEMHINFQSYFLHQLYRRKSSPGKLFFNTFRKTLMTGTLMVVWNFHKKVLKRGGYDFERFSEEIFKEFDRTADMISGRKTIEIRNTLEVDNVKFIENVAG